MEKHIYTFYGDYKPTYNRWGPRCRMPKKIYTLLALLALLGTYLVHLKIATMARKFIGFESQIRTGKPT